MSEIKKYSLEVNTGWDDQVEVRTFVLARDHKQALAQAKREGVVEFLLGMKAYCKTNYCSSCKYGPICRDVIRDTTDEDIIRVATDYNQES